MYTINDWHAQFQHQAKWTKSFIRYCKTKQNLLDGARIMEIGCGTGAVMENFSGEFELFGLDISFDRINFAKNTYEKKHFLVGDGLRIPIAENCFDFVYCHFLLLWVKNPLVVLDEMKRITKPGGMIAVLAEPDYQNRIDEPAALIPLGKAQTKSLEIQGANPNIGSEVKSLFSSLNLENIEIGIYENAVYEKSNEEWNREWKILEFDLKKSGYQGDFGKLKEKEKIARENGKRKLSIPMHFAIGSKGEKVETKN